MKHPMHPIRLALVVLAASTVLMPIAAARASPPQPASGTFQVVNAVPTSVREAGTNCFIELDATFAFQGTFVGSFDAHFEIVHHGPCDQPAPETFVANGICIGSVGTASGTFDFSFQGQIGPQGNAQGQLTIERGTGGLSNLRGMLTLTGQAGVGGTYTGSIHFEHP